MSAPQEPSPAPQVEGLPDPPGAPGAGMASTPGEVPPGPPPDMTSEAIPPPSELPNLPDTSAVGMSPPQGEVAPGPPPEKTS